MPTSATLFTGGGGADIGLKMAGFKSLWGIERDEKIAAAAQLNLPESQIINACVSQVDPRLLEPVDLLWLSPPCQQYSQARRGDLEDHQDKDAGVFCLPYIEALCPKWIILENVPGYAKATSFKEILGCLQRLNYFFHWKVLNAADYGVPQNRNRLILWAVREGLKLPFFPVPQRRIGWYQATSYNLTALPDSKLADWQIKRLEQVRHKLTGISLVDVGKNCARSATVKGKNEPSFTITTDHVNSHAPLVLMPRAGANIKNANPTPPDQPCPTIRAMQAGRHTHWADVVNLEDLTAKQVTPEISAILQSFPESYLLPESKTLAQRIIGNAVPPLLAKALGTALIESKAV